MHDLIKIFVIILIVVIVTVVPISYYMSLHEKDVEENWSCEMIKKQITEKGDTKYGYYLQQLLKKECSFP